jgi:hypothetical protein
MTDAQKAVAWDKFNELFLYRYTAVAFTPMPDGLIRRARYLTMVNDCVAVEDMLKRAELHAYRSTENG